VLISGTVTLNSAPLANVSFAATNGGSCFSSNASGQYSCTVPQGWSGSVTPWLTGYSFAPVSRNFTNVTSALTGQDFTATEGGAAAGIFYVHADHLNTPRLITNQAGQAVWRWDQSDPFGGNVADDNPGGLGTFTYNLRFPGQYFDQETNLHYNYFRDYDPAIGRYVQSDPIGLRGGLNTFNYVGSQPLRFVDPLGLKARVCCRRIPGLPAAHCFIEEKMDEYNESSCENCVSKNRTLGLQGPRPWGTSSFSDAGEKRQNDLFDQPGESSCGNWVSWCGLSQCLDRAYGDYPSRSIYNAVSGPNSNTFSGALARFCGIGIGNPTEYSTPGIWMTPGWGSDPAGPKQSKGSK
jgi:RHS repeat-associated protein